MLRIFISKGYPANGMELAEEINMQNDVLTEAFNISINLFEEFKAYILRISLRICQIRVRTVHIHQGIIVSLKLSEHCLPIRAVIVFTCSYDVL